MPKAAASCCSASRCKRLRDCHSLYTSGSGRDRHGRDRTLGRERGGATQGRFSERAVGLRLLDALTTELRNCGVVVIIAVCGPRVEPKRRMLRRAGLAIASGWYVQGLECRTWAGRGKTETASDEVSLAHACIRECTPTVANPPQRAWRGWMKELFSPWEDRRRIWRGRDGRSCQKYANMKWTPGYSRAKEATHGHIRPAKSIQALSVAGRLCRRVRCPVMAGHVGYPSPRHATTADPPRQHHTASNTNSSRLRV